jgi:TRAP transporter 4TM/12TM fusion protein
MSETAMTHPDTQNAPDLSSELGGRELSGAQRNVFLGLCVLWSLFQLYISSNLPFYLEGLTSEGGSLSWLGDAIPFIVTSSQARVIHLAFAMMLACFAFTLGPRSSKTKLDLIDYLLIALILAGAAYKLVLQDTIADRAGLPTTTDIIVSVGGMLILAVSVYRTLGLPLLIVASTFVAYVFWGDSEILPYVMQWKGASLGKATWHFWMQEEGVFGVALGVSASLIFLFVLFGAILERSGAGAFFIQLSYALLGKYRGGPAKAAVVASAMSGLYSGSSIANTVTTGTFTIPLMKKTGFSPEKAGAIEVASSTNGQLTPPVMGAAAFLIAEFTGLAYVDVVKHAFLPAIISYIALFYIVHLEALKMGLEGKEAAKRSVGRLAGLLTGLGITVALMAVSLLFHYSFGQFRAFYPDLAFGGAVILILGVYVALVRLAASAPDIEAQEWETLPPAGETLRAGMYYFIPIIVLIWCVVVERFSPTLSAFWAVICISILSVTHRPLKAAFRSKSLSGASIRAGLADLFDGMVMGARNMISIAIATAAAGVVIGAISLTGAHQVIGGMVEQLAGGSLMAMLLLVAVMSLILGMGLPTTANYIVVSSLMVQVIVSLGADSGLMIPLIAAHLFVFYFGILADDTPPVGLAAFAAAAISGGDPIKTGIQGFMYDIRTAVLPFLFIFNTELLLIDVLWWEIPYVFAMSLVAMLTFAAATQGFFLRKNRIHETVILLLVAFTMFRPGFWLDMWQPPFQEYEQATFQNEAPQQVRFLFEGPDFDDASVTSSTYIQMELPAGSTPITLLEEKSVFVSEVEGKRVIEEPNMMSPLFDDLGTKFDYYADQPVVAQEVMVEAQRPAKEIFHIPAVFLLILVIWMQRRSTRTSKVRQSSAVEAA